MAKIKVEACADRMGLWVKVGDVVLARRPFPYTSQLVSGRVKKLLEEGIIIEGHKEVFNRFYKLALNRR